VFRSLQCVDKWPTKLRAELLQQLRMSQQLVLKVLIQRLKFGIELFVEEDGLLHRLIMACDPYGVKSISVRPDGRPGTRAVMMINDRRSFSAST
jgi:hypothetical protein